MLQTLTTPRGETLSGTPWQIYPRPQMRRDSYINLNGEWDFAVSSEKPATFDMGITVPFCPESRLSGIGRHFEEGAPLWYRRRFLLPEGFRRERVLLHIGAADQIAEVFVNGQHLCRHKGGYASFSVDITEALAEENELVIRCTDDLHDQAFPYGKQVRNRGGMWYTPVSGIWQTVWIEPVPAANHIAGITTRSDIRAGVLSVDVKTARTGSDRVCVTLSADGKTLAERSSMAGQPVHLAVEHPRLWSPDDPYLYDLTVTLVRDGRVIDRAESYAALREIATGRDANGIERMTLNGRPLFHFGPLDQGWWPDGLYTAPTDEALLYDIRFTKQLGFNMIRKHIKVEPERWYWHCDREGILVWQDMPSGDMSTGKWEPHRYGAGTDAARSEESFANYYKEWGEIMDFCGRHPSVVVWVPYNEAWGQYRAEEVADWTKRRDPSRLVNPASGGNYRDCGDMLDLHNYPEPKMYLYDAKRVNVLGEYGGIGLPVEGHLWSADKNWGYIEFKTREDVTDRYVTYAEKLMELVERGFSAAVYTQTTDVEGEVNGLVTYDREVVKVDVDRLHEVNRRLVRSLDL